MNSWGPTAYKTCTWGFYSKEVKGGSGEGRTPRDNALNLMVHEHSIGKQQISWILFNLKNNIYRNIPFDGT